MASLIGLIAAPIGRIRIRAMLIGASATILAELLLATTVLTPFLEDMFGEKQLSLIATAALRGSEKIQIYRTKKYSPVFYSEGRVVYSEEKGDGLNSFSTDEIADSLRYEASVIVITRSVYVHDLQADKRFRTTLIGHHGNDSAVRVSLAPVQD